MENQDLKGSSTKRETGHLGYRLEPQETVDQLPSELGKDNQVLKQNSCEHLQGAGNDNGQKLHEILKITVS
jgi:hypothetical protein